MLSLARLTTALQFAGTGLRAFGFAAFPVTALPAETAEPTIRRAFAHLRRVVRI